MNFTNEQLEELKALLEGQGYQIGNSSVVPDWTSKLETTEKGSIKQTNNNCRIVLENDPILKEALKFNELRHGIDVVTDLGWARDGEAFSDVDEANILMYMEQNYGLNTDTQISRAIKTVANENRFHPIRNKLLSLKWDGKKRLNHVLKHFLGVTPTELSTESLKLFMLGAIDRVFNPGCKFEYMLCIVGGQGAGKSTFIRFLALNDEWFCDDIKQLSDKDVFEHLQGHWILEMPEMTAILHAKYVEDTKAFLSRQKDNYRIPYDKYAMDHKRQCVFAGTSNKIQFLPPDKSGNRRFLPIEAGMEEAEVHILEDEKASREYFEQLWAEVMEIYLSGDFSLTLSKELQKELILVQARYMPEDHIETSIVNYIEEEQPEYVCAWMLYENALGKPHMQKPENWESAAIGEIMNNKFKDEYQYLKSHVFAEYGTQRAWKRIKNSDFRAITKQEEMELPFK